MEPIQLDFPFLNNYFETRSRNNYLNLYYTMMKNNEVQHWIRKYLSSDDPDNAENAVDDILATLSDNNQSKQMRHYVTALCSLKDEGIVAFCETFLPNYFIFSVLAMITNKLEPTMDKQVYKFNKKLSLWSQHLGKRVE